jgi:hypothetical protein
MFGAHLQCLHEIPVVDATTSPMVQDPFDTLKNWYEPSELKDDTLLTFTLSRWSRNYFMFRTPKDPLVIVSLKIGYLITRPS